MRTFPKYVTERSWVTMRAHVSRAYESDVHFLQHDVKHGVHSEFIFRGTIFVREIPATRSRAYVLRVSHLIHELVNFIFCVNTFFVL